MKKKLLFAAGAMIIAAAVLVIVCRDTRDSFFEANVEALAQDEFINTSTCYYQSDDIELAVENIILCDGRTSQKKIYTCPPSSSSRKGTSDRCLPSDGNN